MQFLMLLALGFGTKQYNGIWVIKRRLLEVIPMGSTTGFLNYEILYYCRNMKVRWAHGVIQARPRISGRSKVCNVGTVAVSAREIIGFLLHRKRV